MKISVILPVKNPDGKLLRNALASVYEQTYSDYEILLVNDGSDSFYTEELKQIAAEYPAVRLLEIASSGVSYARNYAASQAEGELLTYLDDDDFLHPLCFEEAVKIFENNDIDALWGGTIYGTEKDFIARREKNLKKQALSLEELQNRLLVLDEKRKHRSKEECIGEPYRFEDGTYISRGIAGRFIKKEKLEENGIKFPDGIRFYEDAIWNLKMLDSLKVSYVASEWYYYLENEASVSNKYNPNVVPELETSLSIIRQLLDMENDVEYTGYTRMLMDSFRYVFRCLLGTAEWNASEEEKRKMKKHLYQDAPWKEIGTKKYRTHAQERDRKKALLYKIRLLLFIWKYK